MFSIKKKLKTRITHTLYDRRTDESINRWYIYILCLILFIVISRTRHFKLNFVFYKVG